MSGARLKLDESLFLEDLTILGLVSELPPFRLCFFINEILSFRLTRSKEDKPFYYKNKELVKYAHFEYYNTPQAIQCYLTANKNPQLQSLQKNNVPDESGIISGLPLIPNLKIIDYFLWFEGELSGNFLKEVSSKLKKSPYIRTLQEIDTSVRNIQNLLFD